MKVEISYKRVKNLKISLTASGDVAVTSPVGVSEKQILELVEQKKNWIIKQQQKLKNANAYSYKGQELNNGDTVYFLGKPYAVCLKLSKNNLIQENDNSILDVFLTESVINNAKFRQELFIEFLKDRADIILNNIVAKYLKITDKDIQRVTIKQMNTRWGSCNYIKKTINLNLDLITRDIKAIEYVVLHEIAHLTHPNHSREFYDYIASFMPDWKARENILK